MSLTPVKSILKGHQTFWEPIFCGSCSQTVKWIKVKRGQTIHLMEFVIFQFILLQDKKLEIGKKIYDILAMVWSTVSKRVIIKLNNTKAIIGYIYRRFCQQYCVRRKIVRYHSTCTLV